MSEAAPAPPAPKRKLSRKAQLKELAKRKKERRDPDYQPDLGVEDDDVDLQMPDLPVEQPGEASKRAEGARRVQRHRLRGLGNEAKFTAAWLASAPENQQHFLDKADRELPVALTEGIF